MREIKFRAWDGNKIINNVHLDEDFCYMVAPQGEYVNYKLMQYIGLRDINGKEIYEGDIIKAKINGDIFIGEVIYSDGKYLLANPDILLLKNGYSLSSRFVKERKYAVIGNAHENFDLFKPHM